MGVSDRKNTFFIFVIFLGAIGGSFLGDFLGANFKPVQFLKTTYTIGTSNPLNLDLKVLSMTFGINFNINIMTIFGIILAIILYKKLHRL